MGSLDGKVMRMHFLAEINPSTNARMMVLACVKSPHVVGKVPVISLRLTSK